MIGDVPRDKGWLRMKSTQMFENNRLGIGLTLAVLLAAGHSQAQLALGTPGVSKLTAFAATPDSQLTLQLTSDRELYTLGEPVKLSLHVRNDTSSAIMVRKAVDVSYGLVSLQIAREHGAFKRYVAPDFGTKVAYVPVTPMQPGEDLVSSFVVLYHVVSKDPEQLATYYAFDQPGTYQLKAELVNFVENQHPVSAPIEIKVSAPKGGDAAVWRLLQTKDAAYFLHTGQPLTGSTDVKSFEQILARYPESTYSGYLQSSLEVHRAFAPKMAQEAPLTEARTLDVAGRTLLVKAPSALAVATTHVAVQQIIDLVDGWVRAYNSQDIPQLIQHLSRSHSLRKKWEQGEGDPDRATAVRRLKGAFAATGGLSMDVIGVEVGDQAASADVLVQSERSDQANSSRVMKFVRDDDAVWRIEDAGF